MEEHGYGTEADLSRAEREAAEIDAKYAGFIARQARKTLEIPCPGFTAQQACKTLGNPGPDRHEVLECIARKAAGSVAHWVCWTLQNFGCNSMC